MVRKTIGLWNAREPKLSHSPNANQNKIELDTVV
jgi:hypothetical protein